MLAELAVIGCRLTVLGIWYAGMVGVLGFEG